MTRPEAGVRVSDWHAEKKHREIFPRRLSDNYKHIGSGLTATRTAGGPGPVHEDEGRVLMGQPMSWQLEPVSCYIIRMSPPGGSCATRRGDRHDKTIKQEYFLQAPSSGFSRTAAGGTARDD